MKNYHTFQLFTLYSSAAGDVGAMVLNCYEEPQLMKCSRQGFYEAQRRPTPIDRFFNLNNNDRSGLFIDKSSTAARSSSHASWSLILTRIWRRKRRIAMMYYLLTITQPTNHLDIMDDWGSSEEERTKSISNR